ncbi:MAG: hypothetical protein JNM90_08645 [Burkholderiales bacterium]|nr:hypothetical protein [Burkholderiales bacterium]
MKENERETIERWLALCEAVRSGPVARHGGRVVNHTGDRILAVFAGAPAAVAAAHAVHALAESDNAGRPPQRAMRLRIGVHSGEFAEDAADIYGQAVNLTARLADTAAPGETVLTPEAREGLVEALDADIEDLGEHYAPKQYDEPLRVYRVGPPGAPAGQAVPARAPAELRPSIAVIPPVSHAPDPAHGVFGEAAADEIIRALSRMPELNVISRLSTTALRGRAEAPAALGSVLRAQYVLSGNYYESGGRLLLFLELTETRSASVLWTERLPLDIAALFRADNPLATHIPGRVAARIVDRELERSLAQPLPTLESYALLISAIGLMHRLGADSFNRSRERLETLIERAPRQALPYAWLAKWHVLRSVQGWSTDRDEDARQALAYSRRALEFDSECSMALAIDGMVHTNLLRRLDEAEESYSRALEVNPNDSLALLLKGTLYAFQGRGELAVEHTETAIALSPLDPLRYFYDSLAATAALSAGRYPRAIELARRSLKANRTHHSTLRAMAIAQVLNGDLPDARRTVEELRRREPRASVADYRANHPTARYETGRIWSDALRRAGLPEHT